jgi:hypothetical protein
VIAANDEIEARPRDQRLEEYRPGETPEIGALISVVPQKIAGKMPAPRKETRADWKIEKKKGERENRETRRRLPRES